MLFEHDQILNRKDNIIQNFEMTKFFFGNFFSHLDQDFSQNRHDI